MIYYKWVKITIDVSGLAEVIIDFVVRHHSQLNFIIIDWSFLFTSKFWLLLYYFLEIKKRLFTAFYPHTNS